MSHIYIHIQFAGLRVELTSFNHYHAQHTHTYTGIWNITTTKTTTTITSRGARTFWEAKFGDLCFVSTVNLQDVQPRQMKMANANGQCQILSVSRVLINTT